MFRIHISNSQCGFKMFLGGSSLISSSKSLSLAFLNGFFKMLANGLTDAKY